MSWKDKLRPASFRGVGFKVEGHRADAAGRRIALHEYPGRDDPYAEDLGRKVQRFTIDGYVIGDDYMTGRDALIKACNEAGAGTLNHPYHGQLSVACTACTVEEKTSEGRLARFQLTFVQAGKNRFPGSRADTAGVVSSRASSANTSTAESFAARATSKGFQGFVDDAARTVLSSAATAIGGAGTVPRAGALASLLSLAPGALADPRSVATLAIDAIAEQVAATPALSAITALDALDGFGATLASPPTGTPARAQELVNQTAIIDLVKRGAVIQQAALSPSAEIASADETIQLRDRLGDRLDVIATEASDRGEVDVFDQVMDLRAAMVADLTAKAPERARLITIRPIETEPTLVTAYRRYGLAADADMLAARNRLRHPGFTPGGAALEGLTNV